MGIKWVIWREKITLIMVIMKQEEGGMVKMLLEEQIIMGWPGVSIEVRKTCLEMGLPDATKEDVDKNEVNNAMKVIT